MNENRRNGTRFEKEFCQTLYENGFWVHNMAQNQAGQPADVIAVRNGTAYLIDCKICSGKRFDLSRVEPNQESSMILWERCGNKWGFFAVNIFDEVWMVPFFAVQSYLEASIYVMTAKDIFEIGVPLERWIKKCK